MTPPDAVVTRKHREETARAFCLEATGDSMSVRWCAEWLDARERGVDLRLGRIITGKLDAMAQSLANLEAAVRREYEARVAELEESLEMACQNPADGCDCPGCSYAAEVNSTELETLKNG
jgi:hypothetical protein